MSESRPYSPEIRVPSCLEASQVTHISFDDLARVPAQRLARLLLDRAAEDPTLLGRLYDTIDIPKDRPAKDMPRQSHAAIIGESPAMRRVTALVRKFEQTHEPVLITGESGTGKELLARAIHDGSQRSNGPFVAVNCAAIPAGLVSSELFGYEKGAFTGAMSRTIGQIEYAKGGTLFLDEIGDMPIDLQAHLLRFLQEGQIRRLGGRETIGLDVRIVSATNVRLSQAIVEGRFREDLFYRLNVLTLPVPPLRDRPEDIAPLAYHFLRIAEHDFNRRIDGFSPDAMAALRGNRWPGNVRELMSLVRRAVVIGDGPLIDSAALVGLDHEPLETRTTISMPTPPPPVAPKPGSPEERATLLAMLDRTDENITATADVLSVSRVTLYRMLRRHDIVLKRGLAETPVSRHPRHSLV